MNDAVENQHEINIVVPDPGPVVAADRSPSAVEPWDDLLLDSARQVMSQRDVYAKAALGILQAWVGFLMVVILAQMAFRMTGGGLHDSEFITTITTTTASIIAFTFIVARYLFPEGGSNDAMQKQKNERGGRR